MDTLKQVIRHNGRDALGDDCIPENKFPDVATVTEHVLDRVVGDWISASILYALLVEPVTEFGHGRAFVVAFEHFKNIGRCNRINLKMLLAIDHIADGDRAAVEFAFERIVRHAADDLFCQIRRVVFCIAL